MKDQKEKILKKYFMMRNIVSFLIILLVFSCGKQKEIEKKEGINLYKINDRYGFYGFVNGKEVRIEPDYEYAEEFKEGLALVSYNKKYGFINERGELAIPMIFDLAHSFSEGYAKVKVGEKYGYINREGRLVIDLIYDDAKDFKNGKALVRIGKESFYIYPDGKRVIMSNTNEVFKPNIKNF